MGRRIIFFLTAVSLIASCTKSSVPETAGDSHQIVVSIADTQIDTKSTVNIVGEPGNRRGKTSFSPGDELTVYDSNGNDAEYEYKSQRSGAGSEVFVFQNKIGQQIDTTKIKTACYPSSMCTYSARYAEYTVEYPMEQAYKQQSGTQIISAPMACFDLIDNKLVFSNLSCLLKIGIKCSSEPENEIIVDKISVSASNVDDILNGTFYFTKTNVDCDSRHPGTNSVSLVGCEASGVISSNTTYFYIYLPPLTFNLMTPPESDIITIKVVLTNGASFQDSFTATRSGGNPIERNNILNFPPFIIYPNGDSFTVGH